MNDYAELEVDKMVEDIFDQNEEKKRKNLKNIPRYKQREYIGDDDIDIVYRTPNIEPIDMVPKKADFISKNEMYKRYRGYGGGHYDYDNDVIAIRDDIKDPDEINEILVHENTHRKINKKYNNPDREWSRVQTELDAYPDASTKKELNEDKNIFLNKVHWIDGAKKKQFKNIFKTQIEEPYAYYAGIFPKDILNPKDKLSKKINRMWFE